MATASTPAHFLRSVEQCPYPPDQQAYLDEVKKMCEDAIAPKRAKVESLPYGSYEWRMAADEWREYVDWATACINRVISTLPHPGYIIKIDPAAGIDYSAASKFVVLPS